jgi:hypothetical protein
MYEVGTELIFRMPEERRKYYYISVEGLEDCPYSISVSQTEANLTRLGTNEPFDLHIKKGEKKYFLVRHKAEESFKILTAFKFGSVAIVANQTQVNNELYKKIVDNTLKIDYFSIHSSELNSLYIYNQTK